MNICRDKFQEPDHLINGLKRGLETDQDFLYINHILFPTKGKPGKSEGVIFRDKDLEKQVMQWIDERASFKKIIRRYQQFDPSLTDESWPKHYATRFISMNGCLASGENIFMFFPQVVGMQDSCQIQDYFGFEFIDNWTSIFDEIIFPCMRRVFSIESQQILFATIRSNLEKTIYLAAVFHEIGHRVGTWKVSPSADPRMKINLFHKDVFGELSTDLLLIQFLPEFPEVTTFVFLQRLFWFGRFGFNQDNIHGKLNEDNDTWIGSFLWNQYLKNQVIAFQDDRLVVHFDNLTQAHQSISNDIEALGQMIASDSDGGKQDIFIREWMETQVSVKNNQFVLPESLTHFFEKCRDICEKPVMKF